MTVIIRGPYLTFITQQDLLGNISHLTMSLSPNDPQPSKLLRDNGCHCIPYLVTNSSLLNKGYSSPFTHQQCQLFGKEPGSNFNLLGEGGAWGIILIFSGYISFCILSSGEHFVLHK